MEVILEVSPEGEEAGSTAIYMGYNVKGVVFKHFSLRYGIEISKFGSWWFSFFRRWINVAPAGISPRRRNPEEALL